MNKLEVHKEQKFQLVAKDQTANGRHNHCCDLISKSLENSYANGTKIRIVVKKMVVLHLLVRPIKTRIRIDQPEGEVSIN